MSQPNGIHHVAFMAADIKKHIAFFSEVMGCPLVALFDMHGVPGGLHAFLRLNDTSYFSIVQLPEAANIPIQIGVTHAGRGENPCAPGALQHIAFGAANEAELIAMRDRIRSKGVNVIGPLDHGFCKSIYFAGPDSMALEVAAPAEHAGPGRVDRSDRVGESRHLSGRSRAIPRACAVRWALAGATTRVRRNQAAHALPGRTLQTNARRA